MHIYPWSYCIAFIQSLTRKKSSIRNNKCILIKQSFEKLNILWTIWFCGQNIIYSNVLYFLIYLLLSAVAVSSEVYCNELMSCFTDACFCIQYNEKEQTNSPVLEFEGRLAEHLWLYKHPYDPSSRDLKDSEMALNAWKEIATIPGKT